MNTVLLGGDQPQPVAHNTDFSGFQRRWHHHWPYRSPGVVALVGTGGVGRALAFALGELGAIELRLFDLDSDKSRLLAAALEVSVRPPDSRHGIDRRGQQRTAPTVS
ncbi:MAG: hypothetical protein R2710_06315 [Acidimicrobiales bacterium]